MENIYGYGLLTPFQRDLKNDFANGGGVELIRSSVSQILGTGASGDRYMGEMPWRTEFGSLLYLLRHRKNDDTLRELARAWIADALSRWEPRVRLKDVQVTRESTPGGGENVLLIRLWYDIVPQPGQRNVVLTTGVEQTVALG